MLYFFFSMSQHPWECVFICNSVYKAQRVDDMNSSKRVWAPHECRSCSMSAHKSSSKQSHPVILLRVVLLSLKPTISTCAHTPVWAAYSSFLNHIFLLFHFSCSFFFLLSVSLQVTRTLPALSRAASAEALALPCVPAVTTSWIVEGKVSPPSQPTCLTPWLRCKHNTC